MTGVVDRVGDGLLSPSPGIADKVIVITGASSGIGAATAKHLAERGARIVLAARRADQLERVISAIRASGGEADKRVTDVTDRRQVSDLADFALETHGRLDVWINNAGISPIAPLDELHVDSWDAMIDVNLRGPLYGIAAALPVFRAQGAGHVVNILSTAGLVMHPAMAVYGGTKNALRAIAEGLRQEAGEHLRVSNISPGFVRTDLPNSIDDPVVRGAIVEQMGQIGLPPEAIAEAVAFAVAQPPLVDINEITVRPTAQQ